tara:strand:+ start:1062 stop:1559 length:498 start_codon:yes stop_codon:yes gene_type:complete
MRFILLLIFIFGCSNLNNYGTKKIYICGDHPCANKREVKSYFENNISIEVYTVASKKRKDNKYDLVQLNMSKEEKDKYVSFVENEKRIINKVKNRKNNKKILLKNDNKLKKIKKKTVKQNKHRKKTLPNLTLVRLCKNVNECDIDEVAKVILEMDKNKKYPDLSQ